MDQLGFTTVQPAEFLKIGVVLMLAWWLAPRARQLKDFKRGLLPFLGLLIPPVALLVLQPNNSTTMLLLATAMVMYFGAGAPWRDFGILALAVIIGFGAIVAVRPYVLQRVETFLNPAADSLASGYQIQQSLIAVGSGGLVGRGFGQSVLKNLTTSPSPMATRSSLSSLKKPGSSGASSCSRSSSVSRHAAS